MDGMIPSSITPETLRADLAARFSEAVGQIGKYHLSVRWESAPKIVRVGVMIEQYTWESRMLAIETMLAFDRDNANTFAVEFDIVPLEAVQSDEFAEA